MNMAQKIGLEYSIWFIPVEKCNLVNHVKKNTSPYKIQIIQKNIKLKTKHNMRLAEEINTEYVSDP